MPLIEKKLHKNVLKQITESKNLLKPDEVISSWNNALSLKTEDLEKGIRGLRNPQLGGIYAVLSHWTYSNEIATLVMPTGTGKTETMLSLLILTKCSKLLIIVPTGPLREQISQKFLELGLLKKFEILNQPALTPIVGVLEKRFANAGEASDFLEKCNVVVATANILSRLSEDIFQVFVEKFTHIFIDEAHHAEATTWFKIRDKFKNQKVLQFTATPYRNDGKRSNSEIIYCYPLKKAQQEGYFKKIDFIPIHEYDSSVVDRVIAIKAVEILRNDRESFPHILLARVETKKRADEVYEIYSQFTEFKVAKIYSGIADKDNIKKAIINKEYQIIVCVDMLGEGFDLPELKIAALHDVKKSLPTTIQFTGRFTRTKYDENLGSAKIIVNLADLKVKDELDELYAQDKDWNDLLPQISESRTQKERDFQEIIKEFSDIEKFIVSLRSLKPAMSTVIYRSPLERWNPENFENYLKKRDRYELVTQPSINNDKKIIIGITVEKSPQKWTDNVAVLNLSWTLYLIHWNEDQKLLFIHSSENDGLHKGLAEAIIGENAEIIDGKNNGEVFRCLDGIKRFKLQNVGFIKLLGKLIRFQMSVGTDIEPALTKAQISRAKKSHIFGAGYEKGNSTTIGCSYKGRIWSQMRGDIDVFIKWCANIGRKVLDESIDPEQVLKGAIVPKSVPDRPQIFPVCIDWGSEMYRELEDRYKFKIGKNEYNFYNSELVLIDSSDSGNIKFALESENKVIAKFELEIFPFSSESSDYYDFKIIKTYPDRSIYVSYGRQETEIEKFFYECTPEIWFADGSVLEGSSLSVLKEDIEPYEKDRISTWDWADVDLSNESQFVNPKRIDSIQYRCIEILKELDYDIIYDDDGSGEIADIITIKKNDDKISVELYHLKFAIDGRVSAEIKNLYEVCGQAQKSIHWNSKTGKEFFGHLLRRQTKSRSGQTCSRLEKGTEQDLIEMMRLAKVILPLHFKIYIVQPAIQKSKISSQQLTLLGVTENYLMEKAQVELEVIGTDE
jgi:superfamily II DNA or RNA helicase